MSSNFPLDILRKEAVRHSSPPRESYHELAIRKSFGELPIHHHAASARPLVVRQPGRYRDLSPYSIHQRIQSARIPMPPPRTRSPTRPETCRERTVRNREKNISLTPQKVSGLFEVVPDPLSAVTPFIIILQDAITAASAMIRQGVPPSEEEVSVIRQLQRLLQQIVPLATVNSTASPPTLAPPELQKSTTSENSAQDNEPSGKLLGHLNRFRKAAANVPLLRKLQSGKAHLAAITDFAIECSSSALSLTTLANTIARGIKGVDGDDAIVYVCLPDIPGVYVDIVNKEWRKPRHNAEGGLPHPFAQAKDNEGVQFAGPWVDPSGAGGGGGGAVVPCVADGCRYGVLHLPRATPESLTTEKQEVMNALAGIAALSMRTALQFESLEAHNKKLQEMFKMVKQITASTLSENEIVEKLMASAKELVEAESCFFRFVAQRPLSPPKQCEGVLVDSATLDLKNPPGIINESLNLEMVEHILDSGLGVRHTAHNALGAPSDMCVYLPVQVEGTVIGVAQMSKKRPRFVEGVSVPQTFNAMDEQLFEAYGGFAAVAVLNRRRTISLLKEGKKSKAILDQVKFLANCDIRDVNAIVQNVMKGAKTLLNADRSSLFLIDEERNELYSKVADKTGGKEIRFPIGKGIAGTVASTGRAEIIDDAYQDDRFNQAIDKQLGYRTKSILCEPISYKGDIIAVAQLVNKIDLVTQEICCFTEEDQQTFRLFALFASISLSNCRLLEFSVRAGQEALNLKEFEHGGRVTPTLQSYPSIEAEELEEVGRQKIPASAGNVLTRDFNLFNARETVSNPTAVGVAVVAEVLSCTNLLERHNVSRTTLLNFICQCERKYRKVPYHNFFHAVDAVQTCYTFLYEGKVADFLTDLDCYVLLVAALCHDLDHMGLNNNFHLKTDSPLGILSSASGNKSVLEVHHCNLAIEILQNPSSAMFAGLSSQDSTYAYRLLIDTILATDMARHGELMKKFEEMCDEGYDKEKPECRSVLCQMVMKAADISNVTKPFEISRLWAVAVTEEFYQQGDKERAKGIDVMPMFDRTIGTELAKGQLGFINFMARKYFTLLASRLCHGMQWTVDNLAVNEVSWNEQLSSSAQ